MPPQRERPKTTKPIELTELPEDIRNFVIGLQVLRTRNDWEGFLSGASDVHKKMIVTMHLKTPVERNQVARTLLSMLKKDIDEGTERDENLGLKAVVGICCLSEQQLKLAYSVLFPEKSDLG